MNKYSNIKDTKCYTITIFAVLIKQSYTMKKKTTKKATSKKPKQLKLYKKEKEQLVQINLRVTKNHIKELNSIAKSLKLSQSEAMRQMIMAGLQHPFKGQRSIVKTEKAKRSIARKIVRAAISEAITKAKSRKKKVPQIQKESITDSIVSSAASGS